LSRSTLNRDVLKFTPPKRAEDQRGHLRCWRRWWWRRGGLGGGGFGGLAALIAPSPFPPRPRSTPAEPV